MDDPVPGRAPRPSGTAGRPHPTSALPIGGPEPSPRPLTGTRYCDSVADLVSVGTDRLILKTRPMSILTGCAADPHEQVYTRNADGSLHLSVGAYSGDLARR
ncbi:hypothetical protein [Kitasatospora sp. NPDC093679]|uniref:hypothetical protein n=1 Tax=Kitasatospora sp. NPDC093679 TaxID=3154983 RepID=UPI0034250811